MTHIVESRFSLPSLAAHEASLNVAMSSCDGGGSEVTISLRTALALREIVREYKALRLRLAPQPPHKTKETDRGL